MMATWWHSVRSVPALVDFPKSLAAFGEGLFISVPSHESLLPRKSFLATEDLHLLTSQPAAFTWVCLVLSRGTGTAAR